MKTAQLILEQYFDDIDEAQMAYMTTAMREYAKQACKEQRKLCESVYVIEQEKYTLEVSNAILNAPLVELK